MQRGSSMETPPRLPSRPRSPVLKQKAPKARHLPQTRAGPSRRPQTPPAAAPPLPQRSPQRPMYRRLRTPSPLRDVRELSPTPVLRRSSCLRRPPTCTGNVYGELRDPTDIEQDISQEARWERYTSGASSPEDAPPLQLPEVTPPGSSRAATPLEYADPEQGEQEENSPSGSTESSNGTNSSESVESVLFHWQGLNFLMKEGGVCYLNYLLAKADTPNSELPDVSKVREWSYKDLLRLPMSQQKEWMDACYQELDSLHKRDVYDLVNPPPGRRIICNHWVFDRKTDGQKRACLVAKGFSQIEGIDYDDIFSPVVRYESVRLIVALAALQHWHMSSIDVKTAFLYGELDEELFMEQPEGFKKKGQEHKVFRLKRALYGLKQAALQWWRALDNPWKPWALNA
jgi:Reverse transcriptase (RNA-dependent DNA polymerase)